MASIKKPSTGSGFARTRSSKDLPCKLCGTKVTNVDINATAVTCWRCVNNMCSKITIK